MKGPYTNFKDINNKKIHHGDIVEWTDSSNKRRISTVNHDSEQKDYYLCNTGFSLRSCFPERYLSNQKKSQTRIEVIGNIFENKELLPKVYEQK